MSAPMRAGELKRLVTIEQRSVTQDSYGGQSINWSAIKQIYAHIGALSGRELTAAQGIYSEVTHEIIVRWDAMFDDPKQAAAYRVTYNNRIFDIGSVLNVDEENRIVQLLASEGLTQG